jgi:hypothetical protein
LFKLFSPLILAPIIRPDEAKRVQAINLILSKARMPPVIQYYGQEAHASVTFPFSWIVMPQMTPSTPSILWSTSSSSFIQGVAYSNFSKRTPIIPIFIKKEI